MTWFKVDDKFHGSEPVKRIPRDHRPAVIGLWCLAGSWSADHLKDGYVPDHIIEDLGGTTELADMLCAPGVKLWRRVKDGYRFNEWVKYQRTRAQVLEERSKAAKRVQDHRARKAATTGVGNGDVTSYTPDVTAPPTRPDPTRPKDSSSKSPGAAKRGTRVSSDFTITDDMRAWAAGEVPLVDVDKKLPEFIDYWSGVPGEKGVKLDWPSTWRNGMRKQQQFAERDGLAAPQKPKKRFNDVTD